MACWAALRVDVDAQKAGGMFVENRAEWKCARSMFHFTEPFALGFWTLVDVSDTKVTDEDGFVSRSIDQSKEHHHEGANLDQSCGQRDCVSTCFRTLALRCTRVSLQFEKSSVGISNSSSEMSMMECGSPWKCPGDVVSQSFQEVITVAKKFGVRTVAAQMENTGADVLLLQLALHQQMMSCRQRLKSVSLSWWTRWSRSPSF